MRAYRLYAPHDARLVEIDEPEPGLGEVLLRVLAAGVCHSDLNVHDGLAGAAWDLPYTLGHEVCAEVVAQGPGVSGPAPGERVLVHGPLGCGSCRRCAAGDENICVRRPSTAFGIGLGTDGGMADLLVTDARRLVPAGALDPVAAAPLTDAALTSMHAVSSCRPPVEGDTVVVVGAGGLGHLAIQILRALTAATVVAVDVRPEARELAADCGAHHVADAGADVDRIVRKVSGGRGADAVLDFVVTPPTVEMSASLLSTAADLVLVGSGGGEVRISKPGTLPPDTRVSVPSWGTRDELARLVALAQGGDIATETTAFPLDAADTAFAELRRGGVRGRAVLVP
ncbi:NAD(P)-dependent alcohol dehydrogenase [Actinomadura vinacea]|uniref:NAD(P)-dependent alcohol dehydrogenase n=1 Tax=Actinomadura vinacea TaxID=115336 RepID=A0ABN3JN42_9ACTN